RLPADFPAPILVVRLHTIRERCARWLLMTHDRVGAPPLLARRPPRGLRRLVLPRRSVFLRAGVVAQGDPAETEDGAGAGSGGRDLGGSRRVEEVLDSLGDRAPQ